MSTIWRDFGYFVDCGDDGFPDPGKLIRQQRTQLGLSQEDLAAYLGVSRGMVSYMEKSNAGLDSVMLRRKLAKILGIAPFALGVVSLGDVAQKKQVLYDTTILKQSLKLHWEAYYNGGNVGGVQGVDVMTDKILEIAKASGYQDKQLLSILCEYCQLGLDISQEELDYQSVHRYGRFALDLARKLEDNTLIASTLMRYGAALSMCEGIGRDVPKARALVDEALSIKGLPTSIAAGVMMRAGRVYALQGDNWKPLFDATEKLVGRKFDDEGFTKLDRAQYQRYLAYALYQRKDKRAVDLLESAEDAIDPRHLRRIGTNRILQTQVYLSHKNYRDAAYVLESVLPLARALNEKLMFANVVYLQQELKNSPIGETKDIIKLGAKVQTVIGDRRVVPVSY
ncbi:MAG TPA: helix-turn-helix transcriptional regulator [Ktedonobacteraceae bacterium]|nr:helix-turn-helix transcriptional regulator [Ktedonobacteraceae bacterium]